MDTKRRVTVKVCILFFGLGVTLYLSNRFQVLQKDARAAWIGEARNKYMGSADFDLALCQVREAGEEIHTLIKWWQNPGDGTYYFFVPELLLEKGMYWMFPDTNQFWIDGKEIQNGTLCDLAPGTHTVEAERQNENAVEKVTCNMELRYSSSIAAFFLETDSGSLDYLHMTKENEETGTYTMIDSDSGTCFMGEISAMRCRGNASWEDTDKKSYQLKLSDKTDLLGNGSKAKTWLLLANAFDNTLLRNVVAFEIAKALELQFTPEARFVDVYANGTFIGNYLLTEKIEIGKNRINIRDLEKQTKALNEDKLLSDSEFFMEQQGRLFSTKGYYIENEPEDLTGGYLLEIEMSDRYGLEASGFLTSRMQAVVFKSPAYASYNQVSYIANRYQDFEDALFSPDGYSPYTGAWFGDYIDIDSFARKYLLEEVVKNLDASFTSQFFYKPEDEISTKFFAGPVWDYDKSIAASGVTQEGIDLHDPQGLYAALKTKDSDIWYGLYQHDEFLEAVTTIYYDELEKKVRKIASQFIDAYAAEIEASAMNNALRWQVFIEEPSVDGKRRLYYEKVEELQTFLHQRLDFLSELWSTKG